MGKVIKKVARVAAPVAGFALGGPVGAAIGGGIGGAVGGGGLKGALTGAALGGLGGYAPQIAGAAGLSGALGSAATNAIRGGAAGGLLGGDLKSALTGAALGGAGGYLMGGGSVPGLGSLGTNSTVSASGIPIPGVKPTGVLGGLGKLSSGTGLTGNLGGSMLGNALKAGVGIYNQGQTEDTNEEIRRRLLAAQGKAQDVLSPYQEAGQQATSQLSQALTGGFNPEDLASDEGYQFRLGQGMQGLQRQLAASGLGQSGAALKAAQEYGQGLASQEYGDAYNRWLAQNQQLAGLSGQGLGAAGGMADLYGDMGGIDALTLAANQQSKDRLMAALLGGGGILG